MKRRRHSETVVAQGNRQWDKLAALLESLRHSAVALEASIENEERHKRDRSLAEAARIVLTSAGASTPRIDGWISRRLEARLEHGAALPALLPLQLPKHCVARPLGVCKGVKR